MTPEKQALPIVAWLRAKSEGPESLCPMLLLGSLRPGYDAEYIPLTDHAAASSRIAELEAQNAELRAHLNAALDVVVDLGGEVRLPEIEEAKRLRADAARYRWLRDHHAQSFGATIDTPAEHTLVFLWQQCSPEEASWSLDDAIDSASSSASPQNQGGE